MVFLATVLFILPPRPVTFVLLADAIPLFELILNSITSLYPLKLFFLLLLGLS